MAGGNHPKGSSNKLSSSSPPCRKSRWDSDNPPPDEQNSSGAGESKSPPRPPPESKPSTSNQDNPPPKSVPNPSPTHRQPPSNPVHHCAPGPSPSKAPFPDDLGPLPPPAYGFQNLDRRTIVLADGSVISYFALPPDYQDFTFRRRPVDPSGRSLPHELELVGQGSRFDRQFPGGGLNPEFLDSLKRKYGDAGERGWREEREGNDVKNAFARHRHQLLQHRNGYLPGLGGRGEFMAGTSSPYRRDAVDMGRGDETRAAKYIRFDGGYANFHGGVGGNVNLKHKYNEVDQEAFKKAFFNFAKLVNENAGQKKNYLADGKHGRLQCLACTRFDKIDPADRSKDFPDMHGLIMHAYNSDRAELHVDHLGLHKALCILMGWNYLLPPDNSKAYQLLSPAEAAANQEDLIIWPPLVIIHNTNTIRGKDGRMEGFGNKAMDCKLRELGFSGGKSKALYGRDGHLGITLVRYLGDQSGLQETLRLAEFFERYNRGRRSWAIVQSLTSGKDEENTEGEKEKIYYGYLGIASDLDKIGSETRKKVEVESLQAIRLDPR